MFARRCICGRNRSQPFATVWNRSRKDRVVFGGFRRLGTAGSQEVGTPGFQPGNYGLSLQATAGYSCFPT